MEISDLLSSTAASARVTEPVSTQLIHDLAFLADAQVYPRSITLAGGILYYLVRRDRAKLLASVTASLPDSGRLQGAEHDAEIDGRMMHVTISPLDAGTSAFMRNEMGWLRPATLGLQKSAGCGDRLGLATPGHVRAIRDCKSGIAPIFAQQSMREMARTQRTPEQVLTDAMWGVFQEGWQSGYGADADHLKTEDDIDRCVAAGYTFYTFDPGAHVDNEYAAPKYDALPWAELEATAEESLGRYSTHLEKDVVTRAFVKYGRAIAHVVRLYRHLSTAMPGRTEFELEVSVDETEQPTSAAEHFIIAGELRRLQVQWVSLAPRFVGRFEKGVDYIGDLDAFEADCASHIAVVRQWGPYKLSIHSGSDKFSIYPIVSKYAGDLVHLKTAGTSYLEALRTVARCNAELFERVYALAVERYPIDRASYHVSADPSRAPDLHLRGVTDLQAVLNQFDARQMLHVCFGSILSAYGAEITAVLVDNEEIHYADLQRHFARHLESFCA